MIFNVLVSQDFDNPQKTWTDFICHMFNLFEMHVLCCRSNKEGFKGQGDTLHIYDISFFIVSLQEKKMFRDTEYEKQSNFGCWLAWTVIYTNCWCDFSKTALKSTELNPFSVQGALAATLVLGFCCACVVPTLLAVWLCRVAQRGFNVTWVLSKGEGER